MVETQRFLRPVLVALITLAGAIPAFAQTSDGTAQWWKLDEGTGTRTVNSGGDSGSGAGTLSQGPTFSTDVPKLRYANPSSVRFDGVNDSIQAARPLNAGVSNSFAMALWCKPSGTVPATVESNTGVDGTYNRQQWAIFPETDSVYSTANVWVGISVGTNGIRVFEAAYYYMPVPIVYDPPTPFTDWIHVAVVYVNKVPTLYVNGVAVRTAPNGSTGGLVHPGGSLGGSTGSYWNTYGHYQGLIDDVRVYPRTLTPIEVARLALGNESVVPGVSPVRVTNVSQSAAVTVNSITFSADILDADDKAVKGMLEVEVRPVGDPFTGVATANSAYPFPNAGRLSVTHGIPVGGPYDWRYRAVDSNFDVTVWTDFHPASPDFYSDQLAPGTVSPVSPVESDVAVAAPGGGPVIFRWNEATDDAPGPITYDIEILGDSSGSTLVASQSGILGTYAALELAPTTAAGLYWRIRATDAVGNVGGWSAPVMFRVYYNDRVDHGAGDATKVCGLGGTASPDWTFLLLAALLLPALRRR